MKPKSFAVRSALLSLTTVLGLALAVPMITTSWANDPKPGMRNILSASYVEITIFQVKPGMEQAFLDTMVKSGPFSSQLSGLANEKILAPLPAASKSAYYICVDRFYDQVTAHRVSTMRDKAITRYLSGVPIKLSGTLKDHVLANWGWERNTPVTVRDVKPVGSEEIFAQRLTTLSYLKAGYTGQAAMIEVFSPDTTVDSIKTQLSERKGLSGASVYATATGGLFSYSEYFNSPEDVQAKHLDVSTSGSGTVSVSGSQGGVIALNYSPL